MIEIFLASIICSVQYLVVGNFINNILFNHSSQSIDYSESSIFGIIWISFIILFINFFFPIDQLIGNLILFISILLVIRFFLKTKNKKKFFTFLLFTGSTTFLLLIFSNVNRPDAGLYHLPYISLINESKILIGAANIHFRFGHISILQYLSASNINIFFPISSISVPVASMVPIFLFFSISKCFKFLKENLIIESFITFLLTIFSIYSFNRYSALGNDASSHMYLFILLIYFLGINNLKQLNETFFFKISVITIFLFSLKTFMVVTFILPLIVFFLFKQKIRLIKNINTILCFLLLFSWMIKNIFVSGCLIYPLDFTCFKNLKHYDHEQTRELSIAGEAWSKGWSDQSEENKLDYETFNKKFNWLDAWSSKHLLKIIEKLFPFIFIVFLLIAFLIIRKNFDNNNGTSIKNKSIFKYNFYLGFSLFFFIIMVFKIPSLQIWSIFFNHTFHINICDNIK